MSSPGSGKRMNVFERCLPLWVAAFMAAGLLPGRLGAALAKMVEVLGEVPVMLSVGSLCIRMRSWFPEAGAGISARAAAGRT